MAFRSQNSENYSNTFSGKKFASGKGRDYHSVKNGPGFISLSLNPTGITTEPGNGYRYHVYLSPATVVIDGGPVEVDYLVVGGGGGSGGQYEPGPSPGTGGGGAGGMLNGTMTLQNGSVPITVGSGGNGGTTRGSVGGSSRLGPIVSTGGGGGGMGYWTSSNALGPPLFWAQGTTGGSGGGGGGAPAPVVPGYPAPSFNGGAGNTPPTTPPQGNNGGNGGSTGGAGGGGAGGAGNPNGTAGVGRTDIRFAAPLIAPAIPAPLRPTWITAVGDLGTYASGGAGNSSTPGNLPGGGGAGNNTPGHEYTGGGGGGFGVRPSPHLDISGAPGGSGIVVLRYLI